jgi:hypothetical protein
VLDYLASLGESRPATDDPFRIEENLAALPPGSQAARTALDVALDGNLTVTNDPFVGPRVERGRLVLPGGGCFHFRRTVLISHIFLMFFQPVSNRRIKEVCYTSGGRRYFIRSGEARGQSKGVGN